jgi:hypothetical protein
MSYAGKSQTLNPNDTLCFKVQEIQNLLAAAKQKKYSDSLVAVLRENIAAYQAMADEYVNKYEVDEKIIAAYKEQIKGLEKEIKKWKRKTRWTAIVGAAAVAGTIFVFL